MHTVAACSLFPENAGSDHPEKPALGNLLCRAVFPLHRISIRNSTTLFYARYELGDQNFASLLLAAGSLMNLLAAFLVPLLVKKFTKRGISLFGYGMFIAVCLVLFLFYRLDKEYPAIHEALKRKRKDD